MMSTKRILAQAALAGCLALFLVLRPTADARANSTLDWLAVEPVTLMDLGIIRLKQDLQQVSQRLVEKGILPMTPTTGAYYDFRDKQIIVFLTIRERFANPAEGMCLELHSRVAKSLASRSRGQKGDPAWYLEEIFTHEGWGNFSRPGDMSRELLQSVQLEITLLPPQLMGPAKALRCAGGLDKEPHELVVTTS